MDGSADDSTTEEGEWQDEPPTPQQAPDRVVIKQEHEHTATPEKPAHRKILNEADKLDVYEIDETADESHSTSLESVNCHSSLGRDAAMSEGIANQQFYKYFHAGQMIIQAATGDIPACQLRSPTTGLSIVMAATSPGPTHSPLPHHTEEVTRKREVRLMKNREAARECRRKKKEYVKCLENRVAVLENQNKTLIEELKALKDIYCHKGE